MAGLPFQCVCDASSMLDFFCSPACDSGRQVIDDYSFDELCQRASRSGGGVRVTLHSKIVMDEHEIFRH